VKCVIFASAIFCTLASASHAKEGETQYLENADRYILEDAMAAKSMSSVAPAEKPVSSPTPAFISPPPDEEEEESGDKTILQGVWLDRS
jgi:hypothetical protein